MRVFHKVPPCWMRIDGRFHWSRSQRQTGKSEGLMTSYLINQTPTSRTIATFPSKKIVLEIILEFPCTFFYQIRRTKCFFQSRLEKDKRKRFRNDSSEEIRYHLRGRGGDWFSRFWVSFRFFRNKSKLGHSVLGQWKLRAAPEKSVVFLCEKEWPEGSSLTF